MDMFSFNENFFFVDFIWDGWLCNDVIKVNVVIFRGFKLKIKYFVVE